MEKRSIRRRSGQGRVGHRSAVESLEGRQLLTVLTFDRLLGSSTTPSNLGSDDFANNVNFGDRVTAVTMNSTVADRKYRYGSDLGFTPNVTAAFGPITTAGPQLGGWPSGYGDLANIVYGLQGKIEITLTADANFNARLHGFDLAGWAGNDYTIKSLQVFSGATKLFEKLNFKVEGDNVGAKRSAVTFASPLQGQSLKIVVDATVTTPSGGQQNVGIDNVKFSQVAAGTGGNGIELVGGKLKITGTDVADTINVTLSGTNLLASIGTSSKTFAASAVTAGIEVDARGGNDTIWIGSTVTKPTTLLGGAGDDNLSGGGGADRIDGGLGNDRLVGNGGVDTADYSSRTTPLFVALDLNANDGVAGERDNVQTENVIGGSGADVLIGDASANLLDGRGGNDFLLGYAGNDTLLGDAGNDNLMGGEGNDSLNGGAGVDQLFGDAGDDTLDSRDSVVDLVLDGGAGAADKVRKDANETATNVEQVLA